MKKNITEEARTFGALLRIPYENLLHRTYSELAENGFADIRPAHSSVFRHILPAGSRLTELAERAQMTKQSMAYLVDYLHQQGYVEMIPDPSDGRAKLVCLTEQGRAFQQAALALSRQVEAELAEFIGAQKMKELRALLEQLSDHYNAIEIKNGK